jgi:hypothetical protein
VTLTTYSRRTTGANNMSSSKWSKGLSELYVKHILTTSLFYIPFSIPIEMIAIIYKTYY